MAADLSRAAGVTIRAPARLHLGFLDLGGALGRRFGSLGIALDRPVTEVTVRRAGQDADAGPDSTRAARARDGVRAALGLTESFAVEVDAALPAHNGLGSGTQLAVAVGVAVARLTGHALSAREVAGLLGRGRRSAIGMEAFEAGGVILDGGKAMSEDRAALPPPLLARLKLPEDWRILLVFDRAREGLSGSQEMAAMAQLPPFPAEQAAHICHLMLLKALPALAEGDAAAFGAVIGEWQRVLGDHYAAAQGGGRFLSRHVAEAIAFLEEEGVSGVGQSSWGPTGFAIVGNEAQAARLLQALHRRFASYTNLSFDSVRGNNQGAEITAL
ncbi:beta-ribofuranosylaminobenzene 5'-phosphate synthase family protein [Xanthobacter autotrophicus DSM 431]|uniref:beta-ribofuranosylaminobenzene 5'-phosphate synthase family protein n=1 Tax=Xanthobacter nonsaccharivorans TaxID=3119912 RepID=UPI00372A850A